MKTLIAFSGGIDSTYIAWRLLQETKDEIVIAYFDQFYITEKNNGANGTSSVTPYQLVASKNIHSWLCKNIRKCEYKKVIMTKFDNGYDFSLQFAKYSGISAANGIADSFVHGLAGLFTNRNTLLEKEFSKYSNKGKIWFPIREWGKTTAHQIQELPKELLNLTLSCHLPKIVDSNLVQCGNCSKCFRNKIIMESLDKIDDPLLAIEKYKQTERYKQEKISQSQREKRIGMVYG